jgi:hypothetical protein
VQIVGPAWQGYGSKRAATAGSARAQLRGVLSQQAAALPQLS